MKQLKYAQNANPNTYKIQEIQNLEDNPKTDITEEFKLVQIVI